MNRPDPDTVKSERLAQRLLGYERTLDELASPLHYAIRPSPEKYARDKAAYLERLRDQSTLSASGSAESQSSEDRE